MNCTEKPNVPGMVLSAETMAKFFAANVNWSYDGTIYESSPEEFFEDNNKCLMDLPLKYSCDEESWVQYQLGNFKDSWDSFSLGEDIYKECVMWSYGVPLAMKYMHEFMQLMNARYCFVLKRQPEFQQLSLSNQRRIWKKNVLFVTALTMAKLDSCKTGNEQFEFISGLNDRDSFVATQIAKGSFKPLTLKDFNNQTGILSPVLIENYVRLIRNVEEMIKKPDMFQLFALALLFSDSDNLPVMNKLRNSYLNLIRRKLSDDSTDEIGLDRPNSELIGNHMYSKFNACICDVKEIAMIVTKMSRF